MRNARAGLGRDERYEWRWGGRMVSALLVAVISAAMGCESSGGRQHLEEGYLALEQRQYDAAATRADEYLAKRRSQGDAGRAEALYLRGRSLEQRTARSEQESRANLQAARASYIAALEEAPSPQLEAYIRTSLANVAYFQEDFETAQQQWLAAHEKLGHEPNLAAWSLYRAGVAQQRLGRFKEADKIFAAVIERHAGTEPAQRARDHLGAKAFHVQLATFRTPAGADRAANALRREGVLAQRTSDARGQHVLRVGPFPTYAAAKAMKARYAHQYNDALILP